MHKSCFCPCERLPPSSPIAVSNPLGRRFIVAHRLSTIQSADVILVMKDEHIIEKGNHEELLAAGGFYKNLYESQLDTATV